MFIESISVKNYRNLADFSIHFHEGLNVIIGANNSGKTGLLSVIRLLDGFPSLSVEDFNKNELLDFKKKFLDVPPSIQVIYHFCHLVSDDDSGEDINLVDLIPFLEAGAPEKLKEETDGKILLTGTLCASFSLDPKALGRYAESVKKAIDYDSFYSLFTSFVDNYYHWSFSNGLSDTPIDIGQAKSLFEIISIDAQRTSDEVEKGAKKEVEEFLKKPENSEKIKDFFNKTNSGLEETIKEPLDQLKNLVENENDEIGLKHGEVAISPSFKTDGMRISDTYITEVKDTTGGYKLQMNYNGLGYNNLIDIYMLIKLASLNGKSKAKILCLEEPEAHLHPAMQYKLFKFIKEMNDKAGLQQQVFVTTHSSNITAVAGLENMFLLQYRRHDAIPNCYSENLYDFFQLGPNDDTLSDEKKQIRQAKIESKNHLDKFLDVTRSDMLFADKVILVEGIAEKLLLPELMVRCGESYEDQHIAIVEIGGVQFGHFLELFNHNKVCKKVLCITDNDFSWGNDDGFATKKDYDSYQCKRISDLSSRFKDCPNIHIVTQRIGGKTFEDELFLSNFENETIQRFLLGSVLPNELRAFFDVKENGTRFEKWKEGKGSFASSSKKITASLLDAADQMAAKDTANAVFYHNLFFAELFYYYVSRSKGDLALELLVYLQQCNKVSFAVPEYIAEGLKWLSLK